MKRLVLIMICFLPVHVAFAQPDSIQPPFKRFPVFPPVKLLLPDSISFFSKDDLPKKEAVLLVLFNPQCEHCRHETEDIIKHIDKFKNIRIVMATNMPFDTMMAFRARYQLDKYRNIIVGQDIHYFLPTFFMIKSLPFLAFYSRKKELISVFEGLLPVEKLLKEFEK